MDDFIRKVDPKTGEILRIPRGQAQQSAAPPAALTDAQLEALTDDDIRRLSRNRLLRMLISCSDDRIVLPVIKEMLDRIGDEKSNVREIVVRRFYDPPPSK